LILYFYEEIYSRWQVLIRFNASYLYFIILGRQIGYRVAQKSKPPPNHQNIVLNCIKACEWNQIYSSD